MFGTLAVFYLFLGGAGAGVLAICSFIDLIWVKQSFGTASYEPAPSVASSSRILEYGFLIGFLMLALGIISLMFDLGRIDRALNLFMHPSPTVLSLGSYALLVAAILGAGAVLVRFMYIPEVQRSAVAAVEAALIIVALVVMLYTGVLLLSISGVAFWASPFIPALFLLSSLSSGAATLFIVAFFIVHDRSTMQLLRNLLVFDVVIIALEAVCAIAFMFIMGGSAHPGVLSSLETLTQGSAAPFWWWGFFLSGMAVPFVFELGCLGMRWEHPAIVAIVAVLVLTGAFSLRHAIVESGMQRDLVLESVEAGEMVYRVAGVTEGDIEEGFEFHV